MDGLDGALAVEEIQAAAARIAPFIRHTPGFEGAQIPFAFAQNAAA